MAMPFPQRPLPPADLESASQMSRPPQPSTPPEDQGYEVKGVELRPAENGIIVTVRKERLGKGDGGMDPYSSKDYAFSSVPEALRMVGSLFGQAAPAAPETPPEMEGPDEAEAAEPEMDDETGDY